MKKNRVVSLVMVLVVSMLMFTGCTLKDAVTSRKVVASEDGKRLEVTLKADVSKNLEWKYIALSGNLVESQSQVENDMFSDTYIENYTLSMNDTLSDTLVLFLIENGDTEKARAYLYDISFDGDKIQIGEPQEKTVGYDKKLKEVIDQAK
ncbi:MAG: hypothetical protein K5739_04515 [Lachnospiraceae bacterium]|nr:hypothetical protein [Lachnospiraceae bacterium]